MAKLRKNEEKSKRIALIILYKRYSFAFKNVTFSLIFLCCYHFSSYLCILLTNIQQFATYLKTTIKDKKTRQEKKIRQKSTQIIYQHLNY